MTVASASCDWRAVGGESYSLLFVVHLDNVTPKIPGLILKKQQRRSVENRVLFMHEIAVSMTHQ